jgi:hypothetical protein
VPFASATLWVVPFTVTSSSSLADVMTVDVGSGVDDDTPAPADACVTLIVCAPTASPEPEARDEIPSGAAPEPTSKLPVATTSTGEATVPAEICVEPVAS